MGSYIIEGDTEKYNGCLIYICGGYESAARVLDRILNEPNEYDRELMKNHKNIRIGFVESKYCWWDNGCD